MMKTWLMRRAVRRPVVRGGHLAHELIGMQASFHQKLALGLADQLDRLCCRRLAVRRVDELIASDIDPMLLGHGGNLGDRPDQNGNDDALVPPPRRRRAARSRRMDARRRCSPAALL